jgi:hypothetical protein
MPGKERESPILGFHDGVPGVSRRADQRNEQCEPQEHDRLLMERQRTAARSSKAVEG